MSSLGLGHLAGMFGVVAFGAVVPVVPTGAAVSVAAALADNVVFLALAVAFGAAAAYVGDLAMYAVLRLAGKPLSQRVRWLHADAQAAALGRFRHQIDEHELRTLLLSRLVPGGRVPVLLAAAVGGYPLRRYASADIAAAALWSAVYAAIGLAGRSVFPEPWQGVVAAIVLVVLISVAGSLWRRRAGDAPGDTPGDPDTDAALTHG
jgi:membrane protein DedA with SNARE-associated domain